MKFRYANADGSFFDGQKLCPLNKGACMAFRCACFEVLDKQFGYCGLTAGETSEGAGRRAGAES